MCSINGFNFSDKDKIESMVAVTRHRGPDGLGIEVLNNFSLGHARLKIIDLSDSAAQPMWNHKRSLCIVLNGEIYNYKELKASLKDNYAFRTESDTEVLLAQYQTKGLAGLSELNGIFAFAVWDVRKKELVLVRDAAGVKPLYYSWDGKRFIFSSEAKAIMEVTGRPSLNREMLDVYLSIGFVPSTKTLFNGISKLEAGSYAVLKERHLSFGKFWKPNRERFHGQYADAKAELRQKAEEAVRRQMISDRPVGIFLSGGIDSTAIATMAARHTEGSIRTFTTRFDFTMDTKFNADADMARKTAKRLGAHHQEILVTAKDMIDSIETAGWHLDEPNGNSSAGAVALLAKVASEDVAVLLSGDGPDELFGGYERYEKSRLVSLVRRMPLSVRHAAAAVLRGAVQEKHLQKMKIGSDAGQYLAFWGAKEFPETNERVEQFFENTYFRDTRHCRDFENLMMDIDRRSWLTDDALLKLDRLLAAYGVEGRVPFLDVDLIEFSMQIPSSWKLKRPWNGLQQGKRIWVDALHDLLPEEILNKEKTGWFAPMAKWFRDPYVYSIVIERLAALPHEVFDPDRAVRLLEDHKEKRGYHLQAIWTLLSLQVWLQRYNVRV